MLAFVGLSVGLILLLGGGVFLVNGASGIAARFRVPPIVVGLTIVAFGTSAPELFVGVMAAIRDQTDIVFGNVVGSNIANLGLVLGLAAVIRPIEINGQIVRRELPLLLLATGVILIMAMDPMLRGLPATIDLSDSIILLLLFLVFFYTTATDVVDKHTTDSLIADVSNNHLANVAPAQQHEGLRLLAGFTGLLFGSHLTISNGVVLSELLNVPSAIVGLFVVAIGTSLPELVTSVVAAIRRKPDLALGNVVGSNLFNGLIVLPVSASIRSIPLPDGGFIDLTVSILFALALIPLFLFGKARIGRPAGLILLTSYAMYAIIRIL